MSAMYVLFFERHIIVMDDLLEFLQSDTFQKIIMTTADIIIYYAMLAPQLFSGTLLTSVSVGGGADTITDGIFLLISLLMIMN